MIVRAITKTLSIILLIFPTLIEGQHSDVLKPIDIFDMESVSDPQVSPDGSQILYVRSGSDIMTDKRYSNIWIINSDGTEHRPVTSGHSGNSQPRPSAALAGRGEGPDQCNCQGSSGQEQGRLLSDGPR